MKQFFKMFFASFLAMVVMGVIVFGLTLGLIVGLADDVSGDKKTNASNQVLVLDMADEIHEIGERNPLAMLGSGDPYTAGLYDIIKAIEHARTDKSVKGIYLKVDPSYNGWATLQQLRQALLGFKQSGKFIYAYGETIPQKSMYLASMADSLFVNPVGSVEIDGLVSQIPFFKNMLGKLEIEPEIFYAGKFKSATEPFRAEKISEPNREQIAALQADVWNEFTTAVATKAHTDPLTVDQWAREGAIRFPEDAKQRGLVNALAYIDQAEAAMRRKLGLKADAKINFVAINDYASGVRHSGRGKGDRIALLLAEGDITDGASSSAYEIASESFIAQVRKLRKDDKVKAVVLRVNSPGGSALASEVMLRELQLLKAAKPLIVSMGDVAASGGYYISCQADSIFALPNTITGSIGVFTMLFNTEKLLNNKLGITIDEVKNAPYADFPSFTRPLTKDEASRMQAGVDTIYSIFKQRVAAGRKLSVAAVDSIAQGRVWSGTDAIKIGLVDGLGGLDRAIWSAAKKAGLSSYKVVTYPEPVDKFDAVLRRLNNADAAALMAEAADGSGLQQKLAWLQRLKSWQRMNGNPQAILPFLPIIQ